MSGFLRCHWARTASELVIDGPCHVPAMTLLAVDRDADVVQTLALLWATGKSQPSGRRREFRRVTYRAQAVNPRSVVVFHAWRLSEYDVDVERELSDVAFQEPIPSNARLAARPQSQTVIDSVNGHHECVPARDVGGGRAQETDAEPAGVGAGLDAGRCEKVLPQRARAPLATLRQALAGGCFTVKARQRCHFSSRPLFRGRAMGSVPELLALLCGHFFFGPRPERHQIGLSSRDGTSAESSVDVCPKRTSCSSFFLAQRRILFQSFWSLRRVLRVISSAISLPERVGVASKSMTVACETLAVCPVRSESASAAC